MVCYVKPCEAHNNPLCQLCVNPMLALPSGTIERIVRLEKHLHFQIDENRKVSRRIDELESEIDGRFNEMMAAIMTSSRKPHKCPVCDGLGEAFRKISVSEKIPCVCKSCEGKGVLWG